MLKRLDAVALMSDLPEKGLVRGQVGTIVETLSPDVFEVEFSDDDDRTFAALPLKADEVVVLHYAPVRGR